MLRFTGMLLLLAVSGTLHADWHLDNDASRLSFVTVKAGDVAEVHRFTDLSGSVGADGHARVVIQLASVDTLIPIRDERMRDILFRTSVFPTAVVTTRLDAEWLSAPDNGAVDTELVLDMADRQVPFAANLLVNTLADGRVMVTTSQPLVANAPALGLTEGVEKLREIAGLPSISHAVPVSFSLVFSRAE